MPLLGLEQILLAGGAVLLTAVAAVTDARTRRVPNWLTVPAFIAGIVCQVAFRGTEGLADAGLGFAIGFGTLFVLWLIGGGGAGDAKLMGALSVWLGFRATFAVLVLSTLLVIATTAFLLTRGFLRGESKVVQDREASAPGTGRRRRRLMPYAIPVAIATWIVLGSQLLRAAL